MRGRRCLGEYLRAVRVAIRLGPWTRAAILSLAAAMAVAWWVRAPPYDDPYITFRYAANLRDGHGLVFNAGEQVLSTTTPLFTILLAGLDALCPGWDVAVVGYWVSIAGLFAAGTVASMLCQGEEEGVAALVSPFGVILALALVLSVGQEASLFFALGLGSFYFWLRRRRGLAAVALGFLVLTRPDGIVLAAVLLLAEVYQTRRLPLLEGLIFGLIVVPWYSGAWAIYGSPFPFSLSAKRAQAQTGWWTTCGPAAWSWLQTAARRTPLAFGFATLGAVRAGRRSRWALVVLSWPVLQLSSYALLGVAFYPWYVAVLDGTVGLLSALGIGAVVRFAQQVAPRRLHHSMTAVSLLGALVLVMPGLLAVRSVGRQVPDAKMRQYEVIGAWLREHTGSRDLVAALEVGRLGYFSQRRMLDFVGLVSPSVLERLQKGDLMWSVRSYQPDYVVAIPPDRWLLEDTWFQSSYGLATQFTHPDVYEGQPIAVFARATGEPLAQASESAAVHRFGDCIELADYRVEARRGQQGEDGSIAIMLRWRALKPMRRDFTVFVHALDSEGRIVGQADGQPLEGERPTSQWRRGEAIQEWREIRMSQTDLVANLRVGWYLLETMERLPRTDTNGGPTDSLRIDLTHARQSPEAEKGSQPVSSF